MDLFSRRALTVGLAVVVGGCRKSERGLLGVETLFAGFTYVGDFPVRDVGLTSHSHDATVLPMRWMPGPQYIFHLDNGGEFEEIPTRLLPDRLRSVGASIVYAPKSWREMAIPKYG